MINNVSKGWQHIKGCHSKDDERAQNVVIPMVVVDSIQNIEQTSLLIRIHCRNFKWGMERRLCPEFHFGLLVIELKGFLSYRGDYNMTW
jgi:hypothetical protein